MKTNYERFMECFKCPYFERCKNILDEDLTDDENGNCKTRIKFEMER